MSICDQPASHLEHGPTSPCRSPLRSAPLSFTTVCCWLLSSLSSSSISSHPIIAIRYYSSNSQQSTLSQSGGVLLSKQNSDSVPPLLRILQYLLGGLGIKTKSIWGPSTSVSNTYFFCFVLFLLSSNPLSKANTALNKTTEF